MAGRDGQLDEISAAIGEIRGTVAELGRYIHEERHGTRNIAQKVEAISSQISRDIAAAKGEISATVAVAIERVEARIQTIDERVGALEAIKEQERGAKTLLMWIIQSPLIGWIAAAALFAAAWWKGTAK